MAANLLVRDTKRYGNGPQRMTRSYYDLLGVATDASTEEIHDAFRERIKETHPDVSDAEDADERTRDLLEAREVLTDETERERYDRLGHDAYVNGEGSAWDGESWGGVGGTDGAATSAGGSGSGAGPGVGGGGAGGAGSSGGGGPRSAGATTTSAGDTATETGSDGGPEDDPVDVEGVSWKDTRRAGGGGDGAAYYAEQPWQPWESDRAYTAAGQSGPFHGQRVPPARTLIIILTTFLVYPVLLWGLGIPNFGLVFKLPLGLCAVLVIAYLQSMPTVAVAVFGWWTVLLPVMLPVAFGVNPASLLGAVMILGCAIPLGLSLLTRAVLRH